MAFGASPAVAESQIGLYGGWNGSFDSDIHLSQPNGTNMTLNDVPWDGTDGLNEIFLGGQYRWLHERWTPCVGFGVGVSFPHVEVRRTGPNNSYTLEYQLDGVAVEGLVGLEYHLSLRFSLFGDYKLSFSSSDAELNGGGSLETDVWTNHVTFGASYRFGAAPEPYHTKGVGD